MVTIALLRIGSAVSVTTYILWLNVGLCHGKSRAIIKNEWGN
jgi:hypothetical protein